MKSAIGRMAMIVAAGMAASLAAVGDARGSDIACRPPAAESSVHCEDPGSGTRCTLETGGPRPRTRLPHLICDSATLSARYERLYAEQQRMLRKGTLQDADLSAWRARRDACESARCLESLFAKFWRDREALRNAPARPQQPPPVARAAPATHEPASTAAPTQLAQAAPTPAERPATRVDPAPVEATRPPTVTPEPPAPEPAATPDFAENESSAGNGRPAVLALESVLSGLAILALGAGFLWTRRTTRPRDGRRSIPTAMVVAYGLLFVNALLLPFTLGLK